MEPDQNNINELESKISDPLHRSLIDWYKAEATDKHLTEELIKLIQDKKDEIEKS